MQMPFLIISDNPTSSTGLGRITHDIATRAAETIPDIKVGVIGGGGTWSDQVPYKLYPTSFIDNGYVVRDLMRVWKDFAGDQKGVVMTIWNHTWLDWLVNPQSLPDVPGDNMKAWLMTKPFEVWGYIPIDGERSDGTTSCGSTLAKFDRLLAYTKYGADVIEKTIGKSVDVLGHGTDTSVFYPRSRVASRKRLGQVSEDTLMVGCVATNTPRKDWGLAFETCAELQKTDKVVLWAHTDRFQFTYDLQAMAKFYNIKTILTSFHFSNDDMAVALSACDVTLGIGSGEGWGMPMSESLACGVPVVTGMYAGATEFVPNHWLVPCGRWKIDGFHMLKRPVFDPYNWADMVREIYDATEMRESLLDKKFAWDNLWSAWHDLITRGIPK